MFHHETETLEHPALHPKVFSVAFFLFHDMLYSVHGARKASRRSSKGSRAQKRGAAYNMSEKSEELPPTCAVAERALARAGAMELENMRLREQLAAACAKRDEALASLSRKDGLLRIAEHERDEALARIANALT